MLILNPHTSVNDFVKHIAYLIFLIILQEEKIVNTFSKKCLHFYNNHGKIIIYVCKFLCFDLISYLLNLLKKSV